MNIKLSNELERAVKYKDGETVYTHVGYYGNFSDLIEAAINYVIENYEEWDDYEDCFEEYKYRECPVSISYVVPIESSAITGKLTITYTNGQDNIIYLYLGRFKINISQEYGLKDIENKEIINH